ncbi:MAG: BlaI/MecI/CopY family transcriptional regulator [Lachnospiraceae bacterium]
MNYTKLSEAELSIMKCIWEHPGDISIPELTAAIAERYGKYYKRSSIGTFVTHMAEKGFISSYRQGHYAYVSPEVSKHEFAVQRAIDETEEWFHGNASEYIQALIEGNALSSQDIDAIKKMLN